METDREKGEGKGKGIRKVGERKVQSSEVAVGSLLGLVGWEI
jgi:hypothetical protein